MRVSAEFSERTKMVRVIVALCLQVVQDLPDVQERLFQALSRAENCAAWRNPGCLMYAGQKGASLGPMGYAVFQTLEHGKVALRKRIVKGSGKTVREFLSGYNPGQKGYPAKVASLENLDLEDRL